MLAEYSAMLERSDARNSEAKALLAEAEELAAQSRELASAEFMATPDELAEITAHRAALAMQIDFKSGRVMQLHQQTYQEWESFTRR